MDGVMEKPKPGKAKAEGAGKTVAREPFVDGAQSKTRGAIRAIRAIGKFGNPNRYKYGEDDVRKIVSALTLEVESLKRRMSDKSGQSSIEFTL
jgi:hypothetical protein